MSLKVEKIVDPVVLGEGPHWDERQQALFFVSILECTIHKYVPATGEHTKAKLDGRVGFIIPVEGATNQFVVGLNATFKVIEWDGAEGSTVCEVRDLGTVDQDAKCKTRLNDGKADPRGRLFAGTMGYEDSTGTVQHGVGAFYRLDGRGIKKLCSNITISNGLAWDLKEKAFYYTDSFDFKIRRYDYDVDTGEISNQKFIFDLKENNIEGIPDGSTVDADGNLWVAVFNGGCVLQVDPRSGRLLQRLPIPAPQVTSATFGGPHYDVLFVTTARVPLDHQTPARGGDTYMVTGLGVKGLPNVNFKLD